MSNEITNICRPLRIPRTKKAVLLALADRADQNGKCWPGLEKICEHTSLRRTAVIEAVQWLERNGLVLVERTLGRGNVYYLDVPKLKTQPVLRTDGQRSQGPAHMANPTRAAGEPVPVRSPNETSPRAGSEASVATLNQQEELRLLFARIPGGRDAWQQLFESRPELRPHARRLNAEALNLYGQDDRGAELAIYLLGIDRSATGICGPRQVNPVATA